MTRRKKSLSLELDGVSEGPFTVAGPAGIVSVPTTIEEAIQEAARVSPGTHRRPVVRCVSFPSSHLMEITGLDVEVEPESGNEVLPDVRGSFVKVRPTIRASDRAGWDGPKIAAYLRERGARGVVLAPVIIPDEGKLTEVARAESPTAAIEAWFAALPGVDPEDREAARQIALGYLGDER